MKTEIADVLEMTGASRINVIECFIEKLIEQINSERYITLVSYDARKIKKSKVINNYINKQNTQAVGCVIDGLSCYKDVGSFLSVFYPAVYFEYYEKYVKALLIKWFLERNEVL